ncbi:MAG: mechanosensitive ion channel family protein [Acidimicrobiales bacterium]
MTPRLKTVNQGQRRYWLVGGLSGLLALGSLIAGRGWGSVSSKHLEPNLIAWVSVGVVVACGVLATSRLSAGFAKLAQRQQAAKASGPVRVVSAAVGYVFVVLAALAVAGVSAEKLVVGAGVAGIVLGIAAQQSLGNVFAGLVLLLARPFAVGDRIRVRSGALGGLFDARVLEMSLTYVTMRTEDGDLKVPNSAMLAAGIMHLAGSEAPLDVTPPGTAAPGADGTGAAIAGPAAAGAATPVAGPEAAASRPSKR